jgi:hypothetical protein
MKRKFIALVIAVASSSVFAEPKSPQEMMNLLGSCLIENAPEDWQIVSVNYKRLGEDKSGLKKINVSHKVVVGTVESVPQTLEPCRPLIPAQLIEMLSKTLPEDSQQWIEVTISIDNKGKVKTNYIQP